MLSGFEQKPKGIWKIISYYPAETTVLEESLSQVLSRNKDLTGYQFAVEDAL